MADSSSKPAASDRRSFLKIGAGAVGGLVVGSVATVAYYNGVVSSNNSSNSSSVSTLSDQLATTQNQLNQTQSSLSNAQNTISSLNSQLSNTQNSLSNAQGSISAANSQNAALSQQLTSTQGQVTSLQNQVNSATGQISTLQGQVSSANSAASSAQAQASLLQTEVAAYSGNSDGLVTLGVQEAAVVSAAAETIIPNDSNGPGANEAGVIYFIDRQLNGDYGNNGRMYNKGPFVMAGTKGPLTVLSLSGTPITYSAGTPAEAWTTGTEYQYPMSLRDFWRYGILALEAYSSSAYGGNFETLTPANQKLALSDLFGNKPTTFNSIIPSDFANELFFMVWCGFLMDPMYGGNRGMVGWTLTASPGVNNGNFYGEGLTTKQLMVASTPTILKPVSLAQYQQAFGVKGVLGGK